MRFRVILLILFYSQLFGQSTIFVKYYSSISAQNSIIQLRDISGLNTQNQSTAENNIIKIASLKENFGNLNSNLNRIIKIEIKNQSEINNLISNLNNDSTVEYVHISTKYNIDTIPNDSLYSDQWGLESINAPEAWDLIPDESDEIILAVIDTGIDFLHPDIDGVIFKNEGETGTDDIGNDKSTNGIDDDGNGFIDDYQGWDFVNKLNIFPAELKDDFTGWDNFPMDEHGHGTNVSGIIGAEHNTVGIAGVNPNVKIMNLRAFDKNGNGEEDDAASAIIYAVKMGAKVINMSWGDSQYSQLLKDVINYAYDSGVILVASSGNTSSNLPHYPSSFSEVISVGAIQENEALAGFSNYGSTLDLVAPGSQIITLGLNGAYKTVSGTSASSPFISAAASMLIAIKDFSNEEIKQILKSTAKDLGNNGWDESHGAGNLDLSKALTLLSPSEIKFNSPKQDLHTFSDNLIINISCLSPYFRNYELFYGIGYNPESWTNLTTGSEDYQTLEEDIYNLDLSKLTDTSYTLRLLVNRIDENTQEERVNFVIDRTPPEVISYNLFPAILNDIETVHASIVTDDPTTVQLFFRTKNSTDDFEYLSLDGFSSEINMVSKTHFGILPIENVMSGIDHEFYFELTNQAGHTVMFRDGQNYFNAQNIIKSNLITSNIKEYNLPAGRIFEKPVAFEGRNNKFVLLNENETSSDLSINEFSQSQFDVVSILKNKIPISVGDFNEDGTTDILNLFVKNGFIDSQIDAGQIDFKNSLSDSTETFWPSYADDIDNDGNYEIIAFSSDTTITIWEVKQNLEIFEESTLYNFTQSDNSSSIFRNNIVLVDNFDSDPQNEIVTVDNFGRLVIFQINAHSDYSNDKIVEHFYPLESNSTIAKGDYNGDGSTDISILMEFEEKIYITPLVYTSVISLHKEEIDYLFQNMFVTSESNFVSSFEKQYKSITIDDVNQTGKDDLILFVYPNSYIFEFENEMNNMLYYQTNVNSQSIFIGDLDENGINEIGIPNGDKIFFHEFVDDGLIPPPVISDFYSIDSQNVYFEWKNDYAVYVYKGTNSDNLTLFDSTESNHYLDTVMANNYYYYALQFFDQVSNVPLSRISKPKEIFAHAPGKVSDLRVLNSKNIELSFNQPIEIDEIRNNNFLFDSMSNSISIVPSTNYSLLVIPKFELPVGEHSLSILNLRDRYNTPFRDSTLLFTIDDQYIENNSLFITNYTIIDNNNLMIRFNFALDSITALNIDTYTFTPHNSLREIRFHKNEMDAINIKTVNPFGAIGKEYVLKIDNLLSSEQTGFIPINPNSGSEIVLSSNADNLNDIYAYPNPVSSSSSSILTFANLTNKVDIYIYSIDGIFVNKLVEEDGNGGKDWNLRDKNNIKVSSGVYFYKAISLDNIGNTLQEKIGKFAVIK
jgi:Subtilase family